MQYKEFAKYFKSIRKAKHYTQRQFASLLGINKTTYCKIENGIVEPDFILLQQICRYLEIDLTEILELKKPIVKRNVFFD